MMDQNTLVKIRNYGALKLSASKICTMLGLFGEEKDQFMISFKDQESQVYKYYTQGAAIGDYNIDVELAKKAEDGDVESSQELKVRMEAHQLDDLKNELFGV